MNARSTMREKVDAYLVERRRAGFALTIDARQLARFAAKASGFIPCSITATNPFTPHRKSNGSRCNQGQITLPDLHVVSGGPLIPIEKHSEITPTCRIGTKLPMPESLTVSRDRVRSNANGCASLEKALDEYPLIFTATLLVKPEARMKRSIEKIGS